eukprot:COSAG02_NODE_8111_length_2704_cov_4.224184_2_plen_52_part_00
MGVLEVRVCSAPREVQKQNYQIVQFSTLALTDNIRWADLDIPWIPKGSWRC